MTQLSINCEFQCFNFDLVLPEIGCCSNVEVVAVVAVVLDYVWNGQELSLNDIPFCHLPFTRLSTLDYNVQSNLPQVTLGSRKQLESKVCHRYVWEILW